MPPTSSRHDPYFPNELAIDLRVYNDAHQALLQKLAIWPKIEKLVAGPFTVPLAQFLAYSLFRNRDTSTLEDLQRVACSRWDVLRLALAPSPDSFVAKPTLVAGEHRPESQDIGEAIGLCVMDKIFETHEADWKRIPEGAEKTLDYLASDKERHLELEAKGSFVESRASKLPSISQHKASIEKKKEATPCVPGGLRIGTITAMDREADGRPLVWLLDPPIGIQEREPRATRLIHRLEFIHRILELINPTSTLVAALATRVVDLKQLPDPFLLDGAPLGLPQREDARLFGSRHRFFATRSVVADGPAGGVVTTAGESHLFFAGVRESVVDLAERQDFEAIMNHVETAAVIEKKVVAVVSHGRFIREGLNPEPNSVRTRGAGYFEIQLRGKLAYSSSGMVFGWLPRPEDL